MKKLNEKYISSFDFHTHIFMYQLSQRLGQHTKSSLEKLDRNILGRQISKTTPIVKYGKLLCTLGVP